MNKNKDGSLRILLAAGLATCAGYSVAQSTPPEGTVSVQVGPTEIPKGNALGATDLTVRNDKLAFAIAVETSPPWGVARGGIIDIAEVRGGQVGPDRASLADFIPNNWSSWPTTYQKVSIEKNTSQEVVIKTLRDWEEVQLETLFSLKAGEDKVHILTKMTNKGSKDYKEILSGYVLWPDGGYLFSVPGLKGQKSGAADKALTDWFAAYDEDWSLGLHAPYFNHVNYDSRDMYRQHDLKPGESRTFEGWLQVGANGDLAPMVRSEIALKGMDSGSISGQVATLDGKQVDSPAVIVEKNGQPYTWVLGSKGQYSLDLPAGEYSLYATAKGHAQSEAVTIKVTKGGKVSQDFRDLKAPGELQVQVTAAGSGQPLDARITIEEGEKPLIEYFGKKTFYTELNEVGRVSLPIAPGDYTLKVAAGEGFIAKAPLLKVSVKPGMQQQLAAQVEISAQPKQQHWYSADLHHHSDVLDGFTAPEYVVRSQLAAGLDVAFLSDHDTAKNHEAMAALARSRNMPFIASMEISPSWGHFNAYPLSLGKELEIDPGTSPIQDILKAARSLGASAIQANHPNIEYGYFTSLEAQKVPGGFDSSYDLVELNSNVDYEKSVKSTWNLWNEGQRHYFSAGSDTHDVWNERSGAVRMFAKVTGEVTPERFVEAMKKGHAYASFGPLVFPEQMFGEELVVDADGKLELKFGIQAVDGLKSVNLIERGEMVQSQSFDSTEGLAQVKFPVSPKGDTWYSLVVEDAQGKRAYTNPVWVSVKGASKAKG
jgi:hypothetical protein